MNPWVEVTRSSAKESALITAIDVPASFLLGIALRIPTLDMFGLVLLLESVALMLVGGAMEIGGTASAKRIETIFSRKKFEWNAKEYKMTQARGAFYSIIGVIFFAEALALAFATSAL
jgi:hypothetical protein